MALEVEIENGTWIEIWSSKDDEDSDFEDSEFKDQDYNDNSYYDSEQQWADEDWNDYYDETNLGTDQSTYEDSLDYDY
jgi:hypothetical protein